MGVSERLRRFSTLGALLGTACLLLVGCSDSDDDQSTANVPTADDVALLEWPVPYQDFVRSAGGSRFETVDGIDIHYVQTGPDDGNPVLLIHGIPTHAFLWRKVMPELAGNRVIAIDLVGYGRSARPADIAYTPATQDELLAGFVEQLGLEGVHLVVQDLGGPVGLSWAAEHPDSVASVTLFETLWATLETVDDVPPPFGGQGGLLQALRDPVTGPNIAGEQNAFVEGIQGFTVSALDEAVMNVYRFPWQSVEDRVNVFLPSGPLAFPFANEPGSDEATSYVQRYEDWLKASDVPKLVIDADPGALSSIVVRTDSGDTVDQVDYALQAFPNTQEAVLSGPSGHYVQEDRGAELGQLIAAFIASVDP